MPDAASSALGAIFNQARRQQEAQSVDPISSAIFGALNTVSPFAALAAATTINQAAPKPVPQERQPVLGYNPNNFPTSYTDPAYAQYEEAAAKKYGVPQALLFNIRTVGERSNADQVSSAGARTPYQFTPETRQLFMKKYGVDAWAGPAQAAEAAALHLKESYERTGSWGSAVQEYHGGPNPENWGPVNASYVERVMGALGGGSALLNPFNPGAYQPALDSINQAQAAAMTPFDVTMERAPLPTMPDAPPDLAEKDWTKQDELVAGLAPKAFGQEEGEALQRRRLWQGAAQALASLGDDAGVGTILARVGAGMLGGRLSADDEIQARADAYDEKMREYQVFKLQYEDRKADQKLQEANAEASAAYDHAWKKFAVEMQNWSRDNTWAVEGGMLTQSTVDADGNVQVKGIPIPALTLPQFAMQRAQVQTGIANASNQAAGNNAALVNSAIVQAGVADASQTQGSAGMATAAVTFAGDAVQSGVAQKILTESGFDWEAVMEAAQNHGMQVAATDPEAQTEAVQQYLTMVMADALTDPAVRKKFEQYVPTLAGIRRGEASTTERQKAGNTTITTKY